ncbi:MAG: hypothetical protein NZM44_05120 [Candidatus Calescibacterium sp.]|nr:hypothetical protein [Candidatus Calescibacterium sp.]
MRIKTFINFEVAEKNQIIGFNRDYIFDNDDILVRPDEIDRTIGALTFEVQNSDEFKEKVMEYLLHLKKNIVIHNQNKQLGLHVTVPQDKFNLVVEVFKPLLLPYTPEIRKKIVLEKAFTDFSETHRRIRVFSTYMVILLPEIIDLISVLITKNPSTVKKAIIVSEWVREVLALFLKTSGIFDKVIKENVYILSPQEIKKIWKNKNTTITKIILEGIEKINSLRLRIDEEDISILKQIIQSITRSGHSVDDVVDAINTVSRNNLLMYKVDLLGIEEEMKSVLATVKNANDVQRIFQEYKIKTKNVKIKEIRKEIDEIINDRIKKIEKELVWGGDPEFSTVHNWRGIYADRMIISNTTEVIGTDGDSRMLELRPEPAKDTYNLLLNLYYTIKNGIVITRIGTKAHLFSIFDKITCNCDNLPLGGHIHIGGATTNMIEFLHNHAEKITKELDKIIFDNMYKLSTNNRRRSLYMFSLIKGQSYGFEYRTPPSVVWINPLLFYYIVELIKIIVTQNYIEVTEPEIYKRIKRPIQKIKKMLKYLIDKNSKKKKLNWYLTPETLEKYRNEIENLREKSTPVLV